MHFLTWFILAILPCLQVNGENSTKSARYGKVFSLFNVVTFENSPCTGTGMAAGTPPAGICFTSSECLAIVGGTPIGSCASGFGVCCMFSIASATGGTITMNSTFIQAPLARTGVADGMMIPFQVNRLSSDVCFLRLDLQTFMILGPADTNEATGGQCVDTFSATSKSGTTTICGTNSGEHLFVDFGTNTQSMLTFNFGTTPGGTMAMREWSIRVDQIPCQGPNTPPTGCLQYHTSLTGRIKTFNFDGDNGHLANQRQNACIRQAGGHCCVEYQVCPDQNAFTLDGPMTADAVEEGICITGANDFVVIPGSSATCSTTSGTPIRSLYCGGILNFSSGVVGNAMVCDCTPPFGVTYVTDNTGTDLPTFSRGACLLYRQVIC